MVEEPPPRAPAAAAAVVAPSATGGSAATYGESVERWRSLARETMPPALASRPDAARLLDKFMYVMQGESGGRDTVMHDGGNGYGLMADRISRTPVGTPARQQLANAWRLVANNPDKWTDWGEGATYQGKPFGVLGARPYKGQPGGSGVQVTNAFAANRAPTAEDAAPPAYAAPLQGSQARASVPTRAPMADAYQGAQPSAVLNTSEASAGELTGSAADANFEDEARAIIDREPTAGQRRFLQTMFDEAIAQGVRGGALLARMREAEREAAGNATVARGTYETINKTLAPVLGEENAAIAASLLAVDQPEDLALLGAFGAKGAAPLLKLPLRKVPGVVARGAVEQGLRDVALGTAGGVAAIRAGEAVGAPDEAMLPLALLGGGAAAIGGPKALAATKLTARAAVAGGRAAAPGLRRLAVEEAGGVKLPGGGTDDAARRVGETPVSGAGSAPGTGQGVAAGSGSPLPPPGAAAAPAQKPLRAAPTGTGGGDLPPSAGQPATKKLFGIETTRSGLTAQDKVLNIIKSVVREGTPAEATVTPIMRERRRVQSVVENQASRMGALSQKTIRDAFSVDAVGRILSLPGKPTIQDVAARLPEFDGALTPTQRAAMETLRGELEPYRLSLIEQGIELGARTDVIEGGFYLPRGRAELEGADAPFGARGRGRSGGKKGFERGAVFDSMAEGIEAGYRYSPSAAAIESYVRDAGSRAVDQDTVNRLLALTDESGNILAETAADRVAPLLRDNVESIRNQITGRLQTLLRQSTRGTAEAGAESRLIRILDGIEAQVGKNLDRMYAASPTERAFQRAEAVFLALDKEANKVGAATVGAGERAQRTAANLAGTRDDIAALRDELDALKGDWTAAKAKAQQTPRGQGRTDFSQLQAYSFPEAMADAINKELRIGQPGGPVEQVYKAINNILRMAAATADLSGMGIQGLLGAADKPLAYGKAIAYSLRALGDANATGAFLKGFDADALKRGLPSSADWARADLRMGGVETEFTLGRGSGAIGRAIGNLPVIKQANRSFGALGDTLRLGMAQDEYAMRKLIGDAPEMKQIATAMNRATGTSKGRFLGDLGEFTNFAPRYFMSQIETVVSAATRGDISHDIARRQLLKLIGYGTLLTVAANQALGNEGFDYLTPVKDGRMNSNFMRIRALGRDWSLFAGWDSLLRASMSAAKGDFGYVARTKASPIVSHAWDLITGETFMGEPTVGLGKPLTGERLENFGRSFAPFSTQQIGEESLAASLVSGTGIKSPPMTAGEQAIDELPAEYRTDSAGKVINNWWDLTTAQQNKAKADFPEIARRLEQSSSDTPGARVTREVAQERAAAFTKFQDDGNGDAYRKALSNIGIKAAGAYDVIYPEDRKEKATDRALVAGLYTELDKAGDDFEERDKLEARYRAGKTAAQNKVLDDALLTSSDPNYQKLKEARAYIDKGYWTPRDDAYTRLAASGFAGLSATTYPTYDALSKAASNRSTPNFVAAQKLKAEVDGELSDVTNKLLKADPKLNALYYAYGYRDSVKTLEAADAVDAWARENGVSLATPSAKVEGIGRPINDRPQTAELWKATSQGQTKTNGQRIEDFLAGVQVERDKERYAGERYKGKAYSALTEDQQSSIRSAIRLSVRQNSPELDALLAYMGYGAKLSTLKAGDYYRALKAQYGPGYEEVFYAQDAR